MKNDSAQSSRCWARTSLLQLFCLATLYKFPRFIRAQNAHKEDTILPSFPAFSALATISSLMKWYFSPRLSTYGIKGEGSNEGVIGSIVHTSISNLVGNFRFNSIKQCSRLNESFPPERPSSKRSPSWIISHWNIAWLTNLISFAGGLMCFVRLLRALVPSEFASWLGSLVPIMSAEPSVVVGKATAATSPLPQAVWSRGAFFFCPFVFVGISRADEMGYTRSGVSSVLAFLPAKEKNFEASIHSPDLQS